MNYVPYQIYHIYNQGNNRQRIFFKEENYFYFLEKMRTHLLPYVDLLAYCLMPNHFHWLVYTRPEACLPSKAVKPRARYPNQFLPEVTDPTLFMDHQQNLSHAIGIMLSSYTRGINKQEGRTGSLFRGETKAKNGWIDELVPPGRPWAKEPFAPGNNYAWYCLNYIHQNPKEAKLVTDLADWPYSSFREYLRYSAPGLCNTSLCRKLLALPDNWYSGQEENYFLLAEKKGHKSIIF